MSPEPMSRRVRFLSRKALAWLAIVLLAAVFLRYLPRTSQRRPFLPDGWYEVKSVLDGDTITLADGRRIRLVSVDAPEMRYSNPPPEPLAEEAKRAVMELMSKGGWRVRLQQCGPQQDQYGRFLRHVYVQTAGGELMLEYELVRRGLAVARDYGGSCPHLQMLRQAEQEARQAGTGIWKAQAAASRK